MNESGEPSRVVGASMDVTERKQVEEALCQKGTDLAQSQRLAQIGSWQWDPATDTVTWSEELYRIADRDPALPYPHHPGRQPR